MKWIRNWINWLTTYRFKRAINDIRTYKTVENTYTIFTDDIAKPFTTFRCPICGYRGQITSEWSPIAGQMMNGTCNWCNHTSIIIDKNRAETDFLVETWIRNKPTEKKEKKMRYDKNKVDQLREDK